MTIINRQRRVATSDGATFVISEYMHVVASESAAMGFHDISAVDATSTTTS